MKKTYNKPRFKSKKINDFINECILKSLSIENQNYEKSIFDDNLFIISQNINLKDSKDGIYESHKEYFDIHYIVDGEEKIEFISLSNDLIAYESNKENDYYLYKTDKMSHDIVLKKGNSVIFSFNEIHKVGILTSSSTKSVNKIVIKIKESLFNEEFIYE